MTTTTKRPDGGEQQGADMSTVTESIFSGSSVIIPLADVQHIEKWDDHSVPGIKVITCHTRWDFDSNEWSNSIWMSEPEATDFKAAWCRYRSELEAETLMDLAPDTKTVMAGFDRAIESIKAAP